MINLFKRAFLKLILYPIRYGRKNDYDARQYWHDRFKRYGESILGPGNDAHSEDKNLEMYSKAKDVFLKTCQNEEINFRDSKFCEIGLGTGFYTQILRENHVNAYHGYDISDVVISNLSQKFPEYSFEQKDISSQMLNGPFDVILLIDVVQHIVNDKKFEYTMKNISKNLSKGGLFLIGPLDSKNVKSLFYVRSWTIQNVMQFFNSNYFKISDPINFRNGTLHTIRKLKQN